ncbi:MAG: AAA family ATPase [Bacteroidales bacterium]
MRSRRIILVIGCIGSGKTTLITNFLKKYRNEPIIIYDINREIAYRNIRIIDHRNIRKIKKGIYRSICDDPYVFFDTIKQSFYNGVLILDDFDRYQSQISDTIKNIIIGHRHKGLDIIIVFHSLARVMPVIYENASDIILFKTTESPDRALYKLPNYEAILQAYYRLLKKPKYSFEYIAIR